MESVRERYQNDPQFRQLVDVLQYQIEQAQYTPSELREAAILACILYDERHINRKRMILDKGATERLAWLESWTAKQD